MFAKKIISGVCILLANASLMADVNTTLDESVAIDKELSKNITKYLGANIGALATIEKITIMEKRVLEGTPEWTALFVHLTLDFNNQKITGTELVFNKGDLYSGDIFNIKNNTHYKETMRPTFPENEYYKDEKLLFGNKDAINKMVIFTDPLCPSCIQVMPGVLEFAEKNPDKLAVYYYHYPLLNLHPLSDFITKLLHKAQRENRPDIVKGIYTLNGVDPQKSTPQEVLDLIENNFNYKTTIAEVNTPENSRAVMKDVDAAKKMMVNSTPTAYTNGVWDRTGSIHRKIFGDIETKKVNHEIQIKK